MLTHYRASFHLNLHATALPGANAQHVMPNVFPQFVWADLCILMLCVLKAEHVITSLVATVASYTKLPHTAMLTE